MPSASDPTIVLLLGLALFATIAGVGAWIGAKVLNGRRIRAEAAGQASSRRWGGRDRERMRSKYFDKERRARAARARTRATHGPQRHRASGDGRHPPEPDVPGPVNLEQLHGETLGLEGHATPETVRQAYKARVREYHPDQVARLGIKIRVLAEEETKRINEAYAYFRERYGF